MGIPHWIPILISLVSYSCAKFKNLDFVTFLFVSVRWFPNFSAHATCELVAKVVNLMCYKLVARLLVASSAQLTSA